MQVIAVGQGKGGVGKTTVAINVASEILRRERSVTVIDTDPQGGASQWAEPKQLPFQVRRAMLNFRNDPLWIRDVLKTSSDILVLDLPAGFGPTFETSVLLADLIVVPCGSSSLDINSAIMTIAKAKQLSRIDPDLVLNFVLVPTRVDLSTDEGQQIRDELSETGEIVGPHLSYDVAFVRSFAAGVSVSSLVPGQRAAKETRALTDFLLARLPRPEQGA